LVVTRAGEISGYERLETYADLITLKAFGGKRTMWIYGESDRLIDAMVEVAWMAHAHAAPPPTVFPRVRSARGNGVHRFARLTISCRPGRSVGGRCC
jgi:hypothetical protein